MKVGMSLVPPSRCPPGPADWGGAVVWRAGKLLLSRSSPPRPSLTPIVTLSPPLSAAGAHVYLPEDFRQLTLEKSLSTTVNRMW